MVVMLTWLQPKSCMDMPPKSGSDKDVLVPQAILVVDDDRHIREINAGVLIHLGYKVDTAFDGADAWTALKSASYNLLITDHKMPRMTGLELIKKLRSEGVDLAIILMSG